MYIMTRPPTFSMRLLQYYIKTCTSKDVFFNKRCVLVLQLLMGMECEDIVFSLQQSQVSHLCIYVNRGTCST